MNINPHKSLFPHLHIPLMTIKKSSQDKPFLNLATPRASYNNIVRGEYRKGRLSGAETAYKYKLVCVPGGSPFLQLGQYQRQRDFYLLSLNCYEAKHKGRATHLSPLYKKTYKRRSLL